MSIVSIDHMLSLTFAKGSCITKFLNFKNCNKQHCSRHFTRTYVEDSHYSVKLKKGLKYTDH